MKALIFVGPKKLQFTELPKPRLRHDEVLLRIRSVGICGTDLHIYHGGMAVPKDIVLGHEFSGEIAAVGTSVQRLKKGMRVVAEHVRTCGTCYYCVRGKPNLCLTAEIFGVHRPGALAEYMAVPERLVYPLPDHISFDEAALIEPLTIGLFAASRAGFLLEKTVAVVGQGPIGVLLDQVLTAAGAHVVGIDVLPKRLAFVRRQGWAHTLLNANDRTFTDKLARLAPDGVDAVFEAVGKPSTANLSFDIARRDAHVFLLGVFEQAVTVDLMKLVKKELNVSGSWTCSFSFPGAIDLVAQRKISLKPLITHRYPFRRSKRAFEDADGYNGDRMKTVIAFP